MIEAMKAEPGWLRAISWLSHRLNLIAAILAAITVGAMILIILLEIVLRAFSMSTYMTDVVVANGVSFATFLTLGWALETSAMIRVTLINRVIGTGSRYVLELVTVICSVILTGWLIYYVYDIFEKSFTRGTMSVHMISFPKWYLDIVPVIGLALLLLQLVVRLLRLIAVGYTAEPEMEI